MGKKDEKPKGVANIFSFPDSQHITEDSPIMEAIPPPPEITVELPPTVLSALLTEDGCELPPSIRRADSHGDVQQILEWWDMVQHVIDQAYVRVWLAEVNSYLWLPYRLVNTQSVGKKIRLNSGLLMLDSFIRDPTVTNQDVLSLGKEYGADIILPKDYANDMKRTIDSVKDFFKLMDGKDYDFEVLIPLQGKSAADYVECHRQLADFSDYFAVGGVAATIGGPESFSITQKRNIINTVLKETDAPRLHLLGLTNVSYTDLYQHPRVVSCDSSTFFHDALSEMPKIKKPGAMFTLLLLWNYIKFVYAISPLNKELRGVKALDTFDEGKV